jgi:hypothetical protein
VQESVASPVDLEEATVERDVSEQFGVVGDPERGEPLLELRSHRPLAADDQAPAGVALAQAGQDVGEHQGVLLALEAADAKGQELAGVGALVGLAGLGQVRLAD